MRDPSIRQIRTFLEVARHRSFRRAGESLSTSQSNVTVQIRELEERLQLQLFDRTTRTVHLTRAGEELLSDFRRAADTIDNIKHRSAQTATGETGRLVIGALPSIAADLLPRAIARYQRTYPHVKIELIEKLENDLIKAVERNECDMALASQVLSPNLQFEPLFMDDLVALLSVSHPLAPQREISLEALADEALIVTPWGSSLRLTVENAFAKKNLSISRSMEVAYLSTAIGLAREGIGIAIIPDVIARVNQDPRTAARPLRYKAGSRIMGILQSSQISPSALSQHFISILRELCAN